MKRVNADALDQFLRTIENLYATLMFNGERNDNTLALLDAEEALGNLFVYLLGPLEPNIKTLTAAESTTLSAILAQKLRSQVTVKNREQCWGLVVLLSLITDENHLRREENPALCEKIDLYLERKRYFASRSNIPLPPAPSWAEAIFERLSREPLPPTSPTCEIATTLLTLLQERTG